MQPDDPMFLEAASQLKEAARLGRSFEAAQVKVIGLEAIKRAAGDTWSDIGARIRANAMMFLRGCLQDNDLVIPAGDGFLIVYAESDGRDFHAETATINDSLNAFYLGEEATKTLKAEVKYTQLEPRGLVHLIGETDSLGSTASADGARKKLVLVPVWSVKQEAINTYWLTPVTRRAGARHYGYDRTWPDSGFNSGGDHLSLDLEILRQVSAEVEGSLVSGRRCSVHSTTLQDRKRRQKYLAGLRAIPERLRPYLIGRVAEIERGAPAIAISEWVHVLRSVSKHVTIQLHDSDRALTGLESTGASVAAFALSARQSEPREHGEYERAIGQWCKILRRQRIQVRFDNVWDGALLETAITNGADFLTSERVWPVVTAPKGVRLFSRGQLDAALKRKKPRS